MKSHCCTGTLLKHYRVSASGDHSAGPFLLLQLSSLDPFSCPSVFQKRADQYSRKSLKGRPTQAAKSTTFSPFVNDLFTYVMEQSAKLQLSRPRNTVAVKFSIENMF